MIGCTFWRGVSCGVRGVSRGVRSGIRTCTFVWEALDPWCKSRAKVTARRRELEAAGIRVLVWVLNGPDHRQVSMDYAHHAISDEIGHGGRVVCHCINAHHRSTVSMASFLIRRLGLSVAEAAAIIWQHDWQKLLEVKDDQLAELQDLEDLFCWRNNLPAPSPGSGVPPPPDDPRPLQAMLTGKPEAPPPPPLDEVVAGAAKHAAGASSSSQIGGSSVARAAATGSSDLGGGSSVARAADASAAAEAWVAVSWAEWQAAQTEKAEETSKSSVAGAADSEPRMTGSQRRAAARIEAANYDVRPDHPQVAEGIQRRVRQETKASQAFRERVLQKERERAEAAKKQRDDGVHEV